MSKSIELVVFLIQSHISHVKNFFESKIDIFKLGHYRRTESW